jgi:hypothetical protein
MEAGCVDEAAIGRERYIAYEIGVRASDSDPNGVSATEMRRDSDRVLE